jgi:hypothetical protein
MSPLVRAVLLGLLVMNLGIAFGAGLYEHRIVMPNWITSSEGVMHWSGEAARQDDTGRRFWVFVTTIPLTLLVFGNFFAAWRAPAVARTWWMTAALVSLVERILTFGYFIPTMVSLLDAPDSSQSVERAVQWASLNDVRHGLVLAALLCAQTAFWFLAQHHASSAWTTASALRK